MLWLREYVIGCRIDADEAFKVVLLAVTIRERVSLSRVTPLQSRA